MIIPDLQLEKSLWEIGIKNIAGVDEAGKGPLAGPVTAAAVMIHSENQLVKGVRDSKKMSCMQREKAFDTICTLSSAYGIGIVSSECIDIYGIEHAVQQAMLMALSNLVKTCSIQISFVLVDGSKTRLLPNYRSQRIKKGDLYHYSISAASVLAKVTRDRIMKKYSQLFPCYGFEKHVGYGTREHLRALEHYGICRIHRKSYEPVKRVLRIP